MARIAPSTAFASVPVDDLGKGDRINLGVAAILGHRPEVAGALGSLKAALHASGTLPPRLVELVRLRIAFHNQCRSCMAMRFQDAIDDGLTDQLVCSLEKPEEAPDITDAERAALRYADLFATNHLLIDDAVYDDLREYFSESELVDIALLCGLYVGTGRMMASLLITDDLPDELRGPASTKRDFVPWGVHGLVFEPLADPAS